MKAIIKQSDEGKVRIKRHPRNSPIHYTMLVYRCSFNHSWMAGWLLPWRNNRWEKTNGFTSCMSPTFLFSFAAAGWDHQICWCGQTFFGRVGWHATLSSFFPVLRIIVYRGEYLWQKPMVHIDSREIRLVSRHANWSVYRCSAETANTKTVESWNKQK